MVNLVLIKAEELNYQIVRVEVFSDNTKAINLYQKFGFEKYGCLPNGLYRKNKYSDKIEMYKKI
jgi:RimJ/RimL family protein N-acetyltransferase